MIDTVVLLAAGESSRFWPLTNKPLFLFLDKPLIIHQLERLSRFCNHVIIAIPNGMKGIYEHVTDKFNVTLIEQQGFGQAAGVFSAKEHIFGSTLILNVNDLYHEYDLKLFIENAASSNVDILLLSKEMKSYFPGGYLVVENNLVTNIIEKPGEGNEPSNIVRLAVDYLKDGKAFVDSLIPSEMISDDYYEKKLVEKIKSGKSVGYLLLDKDWFYLKYPWHVLSMQEYFLKSIEVNKYATANIHPSAIIEGDVYIGNNVTIHNHAKIVGPTYIGNDTIIGSYSTVIRSHISSNVTIGGYSEVTRSYLAPFVSLHRNYVGDSILDEHTMLGAGVVLSNYRFDGKEINSIVKGIKTKTGKNKLGLISGKHVKIGCNATIYPGVKLSAHSIITPGNTIKKDSV